MYRKLKKQDISHINLLTEYLLAYQHKVKQTVMFVLQVLSSREEEDNMLYCIRKLNKKLNNLEINNIEQIEQVIEKLEQGETGTVRKLIFKVLLFEIRKRKEKM